MEKRGEYLPMVSDREPAQQVLQIMPVMDAKHFLARRKAMYDMIREEAMIEGVDYGTLPGTEKPTLFKSGAEKLLQLFGMTYRTVPVEIIEQWDGPEPFLYYKYECEIRRGGLLIVGYTGICHSRETKYRYRWVPAHEVPRLLDRSELESRVGKASEYAFAIRKAETTGRHGKPAEYWQAFVDAIHAGTAHFFKKSMGQKVLDAYEIDLVTYRIPNPEVPDLAHTLSAMAQKRAIVGGCRYATNASDVFDVSEMVEEGDIVIDGMYSEVDAAAQEERQQALDKAKNGGRSKADPASLDKAKDVLCGTGGAAKSSSKAMNALRKAFGEQAGDDVPPGDEELELAMDRLRSLVNDPDGFLQAAFGKSKGGLSVAHVRAIMVTDEETLKQAAGG